MASNFDYSVSYPFSTAEMWNLISSEDYWKKLIARTNDDLGSVEAFSHNGDTVTITTKQGISASDLPSAVTAVRPGDLEIPRTIEFTNAGDTIIGAMEASVSGAPAKIHGDIVITGDPAEATYTGSTEVGIPLVGGKIEKAVNEQVQHLLDAERDATVEIQQS